MLPLGLFAYRVRYSALHNAVRRTVRRTRKAMNMVRQKGRMIRSAATVSTTPATTVENGAAHRNRTGKDYTSLSARMWNGQLDLVARAAHALHMTVPEYVRFRLVPLAARDLGEPMPDFAPFASRGRPSEVAFAAAQLGLSVTEFRKRAVEVVARQAYEKIAAGDVEGASSIEKALSESVAGVARVPTRSDVAPRVGAPVRGRVAS